MLLTAFLLGLVLAPLTACGRDDGDAEAPGQSSTELPTLTPPTAPPSAPTDVIRKSRVTGVLHRDGACAVLDGPNGRWVLLDLDPRWEDGAALRVTGRARPERSTLCEGVPYSVTSIERIET